MNNLLKKFICLTVVITSVGLIGCGNKSVDDVLELSVDNKTEVETSQEDDEKEIPETEENPVELELSELSAEEDSGELYVYICGEVNAPGVYTFAPGSRIYEAIEAAGGFTEYADAENVNQADPLIDGEMIRIGDFAGNVETLIFTGSDSTELDIPGTDEKGNFVSEDSDKVNINTATVSELTTLNGIGETRAEDIISYRESKGPFKNIEDIKKVSGIGDSTYEKIKDNIRVK